MTCKTHPDAPHGFDRNGSHAEDRYVCMCEHWEPPQPDPMELAADLEKFATNPSERQLAKELGSLLFDHSTLKVENAKLKKDLHHYMLAANAEAQLVDELQNENQQLAEFVVAVGGFWGHTRSKLVGEDSLAECIDGCIEQNEQLRQQNTELDAKLAGLEDRIQSIYGQLNDTEKEVDDLRLLLRQALEALDAMNPYPASKEEQRATAITAIKERLNLTKGS
jgi:DNA repair exonuclease SbcCD ATPase subunit